MFLELGGFIPSQTSPRKYGKYNIVSIDLESYDISSYDIIKEIFYVCNNNYVMWEKETFYNLGIFNPKNKKWKNFKIKYYIDIISLAVSDNYIVVNNKNSIYYTNKSSLTEFNENTLEKLDINNKNLTFISTYKDYIIYGNNNGICIFDIKSKYLYQTNINTTDEIVLIYNYKLIHFYYDYHYFIKNINIKKINLISSLLEKCIY